MEQKTEIPSDVRTKTKQALAGWPMILGWIAMLIFAFHACTHMVGAGDTWVAMACGRHFLNHGIDTVEPFSANSHKAGPTQAEIEKWPDLAQRITEKVGIDTVKYWHPTGWVNQNWLTHVIFYWLSHESPFADAESFSFNTLVYWKFAVYILTVICVYYTARTLRVNPALAAVFACFAMFIARSFLDIRPAGFSNLMVAVYLLVLVLATYRNILYIWLIVPIAIFWCNVHGGYIYLFIMLAPYVGLNFLTSFSKKGFVSIGRKGVYHAAAAGFVAFLATIIFNPFHLTNLTHTFVISLSEHAERWRDIYEWHPAFEWNNPIGDEIPFLIMYIIAWLTIIAWAVILLLTSNAVRHRRRKRKSEGTDEYQWPKIDLSLMAIAALTIFMAIRSRRFISIAPYAACPVIAMLIDQAIRSISAVRNFNRQKKLIVRPMSRRLQLVFTIAGAVAVVFFGSWWGIKYKRIYLDPWPTDPEFSSVFMRMTASGAKPFYACKFIRDNKLEGKMFNYWTEGGFIGWGQDPDPNTGRTPLQLFMDGRAQAAYDRKTFDLWTYIMAGGPDARIARIRKQKIDYVKVGQWMNKEFKNRKVWVLLMPGKIQGRPPLPITALNNNPDWRMVFVNDKQNLLVDITTPQGKKLFDGIATGQTIYPDEFSRNYTIAYNLLSSPTGVDQHKQGLDLAIKAFELKPSHIVIRKIMQSWKFPELRPAISIFCKNYIDDFNKNKIAYAKQDGYLHRLWAALMTGSHLRQIAAARKNSNAVETLNTMIKQYEQEQKTLYSRIKW